jgi:hypothetical protein
LVEIKVVEERKVGGSVGRKMPTDVNIDAGFRALIPKLVSG